MRPSHAPLLLCLAFACGDDGGSESTTRDTTASTEPADPGTTTGQIEPTTGEIDPTTGEIDPTTGAASTTAATDDGTTSGDDSTTGATEELPPIDSPAALEAWLARGAYKTWAAESAVHPSTGPHGGNVRTFVNAVALASLAAEAAEHPEDATTVKELYGAGTDTIVGYAVSRKTAAESQAGATWYWYERLNDTTYASDLGVGLCTGCHGGGADYILTPYPLQ